jgi:hypothetical protein
MTDYDVWEFLSAQPTEAEVLQTLGIPDSVWTDDTREFKVMYYFISRLQDYNSVEVDLKSSRVTGFEWD